MQKCLALLVILVLAHALSCNWILGLLRAGTLSSLQWPVIVTVIIAAVCCMLKYLPSYLTRYGGKYFTAIVSLNPCKQSSFAEGYTKSWTGDISDPSSPSQEETHTCPLPPGSLLSVTSIH